MSDERETILVALAPAPTSDTAPTATRTLRGGQLLCEALLANGVDTAFGYPGGAALPLYRDLDGYGSLRHVLVRHEQNAAHAADGYARATGRVGVCMATSGPGATNLLTGLATAFMDCVPVLAITGQVARAAIGTQAFQEVDVLSMVGPITKAAFQVERPEDIPRLVATALEIARHGRPGPVLLDLPKDVQMAAIEVPVDLFGASADGDGHSPDARAAAEAPSTWDRTPGSGPYDPSEPPLARPVASTVQGATAPIQTAAELAAQPFGTSQSGSDSGRLSPAAVAGVDQALALLHRSDRPVVIAGHGVNMANADAELFAFAGASGAPVGTTLLGLGAFPEHHPQALGMVGMHGTVQANLAMHHADLVIGVGMRFDDRVVGRPRDFAPDATIVHVDVDPNAFGRVVRADVAILGDARAVLRAFTERVQYRERNVWWSRLREWTDAHADCGTTDTATAPPDASPTTPEVVKAVRAVAGGSATIVSDIGQHQMFVALHHGFEWPGQFFTSGGLGTMGYALPAAMGVKVAAPERAVWVVVGDGGFQMSAPELSTLAATPIPLKVVVVNNQCLGMVRQWQEFFYDNIYSHSLLPQPDFPALARAHGCWAASVTRRDELEATLRAAAAAPGPAVVDVRVPVEETVYPMVAAGTPPGEVRCVDPVDAAR
jgi:acetolactate synthase I/II/III large subunit